MLCGVDVGGTFTDCCLVDEFGRVFTGKVSSTPDDPTCGVIDSISAAAAAMDVEIDDLLSRVDRIVHGSTVATNTMLERTGARVGLIATAGFGDGLFIQRGFGKVAGLPPSMITRLSKLHKPTPLVERSLVEEVPGRIDWKGAEVVALDEDAVREAVVRLVAKGAQALAVCLLWSFVNPAHERRVCEIVQEMAPGLFVSASSDIAPRWGEYERTVATVANVYVGPRVAGYVGRLGEALQVRGVHAPLHLLHCAGGMMTAQRATEEPVLTLQSGPAGGAIGAAQAAAEQGWANVIVTDMGGTSFDVALVVNGVPLTTDTSIMDQFEFYVPTIAVKSIGTGGGSIVWIDERSATMKVGPRSAGADPGPVAYGRGGTEPTITDANIVLGRISPDGFLGGQLPLDRDAAVAAFERIGAALGMSAHEAAAGAVTICELQMAELIRQLTVEQGYDPRDFVVLACGGAGPTHAGGFSAALRARSVVVPLGDVSSAWSAYGAARADILHRFEQMLVTMAPLDPALVGETFAHLEFNGRAALDKDGVSEDRRRLRRLADLRYKLQIHHVEIEVPDGPIDEALLAEVVRRFERKYTELYGAGAGFAGAGIELGALRVEARGVLPASPPALPRVAASKLVPVTERDVYWYDLRGTRPTKIYEGTALAPGVWVDGPAVIGLPHTTVVVNPGQRLVVDHGGSMVLELEVSDGAGT